MTFAPAVLVLAGEGDYGLVGTLALRQIVADGVVVADGALNAARDHHGPRLPAYLAKPDHLLVEVVHHDFGLQADGVLVVLDISAQLLPGPLGVELRVVSRRLDQPVIAVYRRVMLQHVDDEVFLNRLLHGVDVEGDVPGLVSLGDRRAEDLQRLVLGRRREGEVAGVGQELLRLHQPVDRVLGGLVFSFVAGFSQCHGYRRRRASALARMRLVDDDGEPAPAVIAAYGVEDVLKLLDGRYDYLLALPQEGSVGRWNSRHDPPPSGPAQTA